MRSPETQKTNISRPRDMYQIRLKLPKMIENDFLVPRQQRIAVESLIYGERGDPAL